MTDVVFVNGHVVTADPSQPRAEAVAVTDGRITAVGTNVAVLNSDHPSPPDEVIDLAGAVLLPGFVEAHPRVPPWSPRR